MPDGLLVKLWAQFLDSFNRALLDKTTFQSVFRWSNSAPNLLSSYTLAMKPKLNSLIYRVTEVVEEKGETLLLCKYEAPRNIFT